MLHFVEIIKIYLKSEARNPKSETNLKFKIQMSKTSGKNLFCCVAAPKALVLNFVFWTFEFVSNFDIRISNFLLFHIAISKCKIYETHHQYIGG